MRLQTMVSGVLAGGCVSVLLGLGAAGAANAPAAIPAGVAEARSYNVDKGHSAVLFRIKHLGVANFYGRFNQMSGTFVLDDKDPSASQINIEVVADSVDTDSDRREQHLKSPDFFNVRQFPTLSFKSTKVESAGEGMFKVTGDLTLLAETRSITIDLERVGEGKTAMGQRAGFETTFDIKRSDYGMTYMLDKLGDDIRLIISIEGISG